MRPARDNGEGSVTKLASREMAALDPHKFMAVIGKRVIHPGGRASTAVPYLGYIVIAGTKPQ